MTKTRLLLVALVAGLLSSTAAHAGDVRIMWYSDGVEGEVLQDLLNRFMKDNPDITVTIDNVAYSTITDQLPVQLAAGSGPDIARVTNLKAQSQYWLDLTPYLKDADVWRKNFGDQADWMRPDGSNAITGFMTQVTLTGGFANKTLFEQAGVALPGPKATWDEWVAAAEEGRRQPAGALRYRTRPLRPSPDRTRTFLSAPTISAPDGMPAPLDEGAKAFIARFVGWNNDGTAEKAVWVSAAGTTYRAASDDFINGQLVFYYSGSWQIPNFATKIGNAFDWVATG